MKPDDWYAETVYWAAQSNIVQGHDDGSFLSNQLATREQLALMLWRYSGSSQSSADLSHFSDENQIGSYTYDVMQWAYENGVIRGYEANLSPRGQATRAEVAQMIKNLLEQKQSYISKHAAICSPNGWIAAFYFFVGFESVPHQIRFGTQDAPPAHFVKCRFSA